MTCFKFEAIYLLPPGEHDDFQLSGAIIDACRDLPGVIGDPIIDVSPPMCVEVYFSGEPSDAAETINEAILSGLPDWSSRLACKVSGCPASRGRAAPAGNNILVVRGRP